MSRLAPAGDRALLLEQPESSALELHAIARAIRRRPDVLACIPGASSLYIVFDREVRNGFAPPSADVMEGSFRTHRIEVRFDGADHEEFFQLVSRDQFFARLPSITLTARYLGFRAGFAYLEGWPREWAMPRRPTSRNRVPRGSFGIAGATAGFYPVDSPGGWNLLGRTDAVLWDARRTPPNLIAAGDRVQLIATERTLELQEIVEDTPGPSLDADFSSPLARVTGPPDWTRLASGSAPGGAFDPEAAVQANRLVGSPDEAPVLECAMAGPRVRLRGVKRVAWVGADCELPNRRAFVARGEVDIGRIRNGLRGWLAIGGTDTPPRTIEAFERGDDRLRIEVVAGPHETTLREVECEVTTHLDRVGIRLRPIAPLPVTAPADLPSCGMQFGTVQLHPDGSLVAMGPDHPITGGYLQPFTVKWDQRWKLAQLTPGERVVFTSR